MTPHFLVPPAADDGAPAPLAGERLIDVGGHRRAIRCTGSGSAAVMLGGMFALGYARRYPAQVAGATHASLLDEQHDAPQSARAIREIVAAVRNA